MTARSESSDLAPLLQSFFTDKLMRQRQASPNTIAAYRDAFTLLLGFGAPPRFRIGDPIRSLPEWRTMNARETSEVQP